MTALIIYLAVVAAAWILISRSVRRAPRDIELWHPWELLMDEKPAFRAEVLRHYPEITESWKAGDSPQQFLEKHPQIACSLYLAAVWTPPAHDISATQRADPAEELREEISTL